MRLRSSYERSVVVVKYSINRFLMVGTGIAFSHKMAEQGERARGGGDLKKELQPVTLSGLDIERIESHRWQTVASLPEPDFEKYIAETKDEERELTTAGALKLAQQLKREAMPFFCSKNRSW